MQPEAIGRIEQVLGDVAACDVHQNVSCYHLHLRWVASNPAGAGEASALHGAGTLDRLMDDGGQGWGRGNCLCEDKSKAAAVTLLGHTAVQSCPNLHSFVLELLGEDETKGDTAKLSALSLHGENKQERKEEPML